MRITTRRAWTALGLAALITAAGCTTKESTPPELTGPSELGLSVKVTATPDVLTMDGSSQSAVVVEARNSQAQPVPNLGLRAEIVVGGQIVDIGRLSSKTAVTAPDGRATFTYTAPLGASSGNSDSGDSVVSVRVVPAGNDYSNAVPRSVDIRLVPQGVILPPPNTPVARFRFNPTAPNEGQAVAFDASDSIDIIECPAGATSVDQCTGTRATLVDYAWDFGDGARGNGVRTSHPYARAGSYTINLTVTNSRGVQASTSAFVTVGAGADPSAAFTVSPSSASVNESVFFNASGSKAAAGRTLVAYDWTFGDGGTGAGVNVSHRYNRTGSFTVTLTVTDDIGKKGTASNQLQIGAANAPTAVIAYSPSSPLAGQTISFDASQSAPSPGRSLTAYEWAFGDGSTATGVRTDHRYATPGEYTVILTVADSGGGRSTTSVKVNVASQSTQNPTASFISSPSPSVPGQTVTFDASASAAQGGATIVSYEWAFGDNAIHHLCPSVDPICNTGAASDGKRVSYAYGARGTWTVTLTVTDSQGRKATIQKAHQVQ
jgi:PKD repeat protein